ncbi:winged helix-turn-helix domain-containing protein [Streptomyces sp. NBC_01803]|uniref:winged helix-turn-helix domain-containing protein n=1 Tax=Streptomyces sp. NBC_01803 TaxID=2975946 RepID=UPI002DD7FC73|nr:winged helix-turn-helix domain-containing protein [Streptomyces sp. NBC_01803]WSA43771.1 winged helix-turn-helix domain-containing protein [Streptomyces sp. NBC_01803]
MRHLTALPDLSDLSDVTVTLVPDTTETAGGTDSPVPLVGYLVLAPAGTQPDRLSELLAAARSAPVPVPSVPAVPPVSPVAEPGIIVDTDKRSAIVDGTPLSLTYLEFELLAHLVRHPHRVYSREQLVATIWGYGPVGDQRTVDVHIARLRRKLGAPYRERIVTVRRVGYKYVPQAG